MNFIAFVVALVLGVQASEIKPVDANAFVAELNGLLVKYKLPSNNLILGQSQSLSTNELSVPPKPKESSNSDATIGTMSVDINKDEFDKALTENKLAAQPNQYQGFMNSLKLANITSKIEAAMYLAQLLQDSEGLTLKVDKKCVDNQEKCAADFGPTGGVGEQGKLYFGRGFLKLRGAANYYFASRDLHGSDDLVKNPDKVGKDDGIAWDVSGWIWKTFVHNTPGVADKGQLGASTFALTQGKGCLSGDAASNANRRKYYETIFKIFNLPGTPDSTTGC